MNLNLNGKKIVVVGGSSGIGLAAAKQLAQLGGRVTIAGRDAEKLRSAAGSAGVALETRAVDATSSAALRAFFRELGSFDHLVLTMSGAKGGGPFAELSMEALREGFESKFFPHFAAAQAALPYLSKDGSITFVSAISARGSMPGTSGLAAINGAIESLVKPLARELKPLRVNAISPGAIETPWWDALPPEQRRSLLQSVASLSLVNRNGQPDEVAQAIVFVVTNGFMTGTVIEIDGGLRLN
jgi:NAD(P)-dependent dehydrogenase (short-subunit alcohol dehydrogenase family)